MNLEDIVQNMKRPQPGGLTGPSAVEGLQGMEGMKKMAQAGVAALAKVAEILLPIIGSDTPEGKAMLSAVRDLTKAAGGAKASDAASALLTLVSLIHKGDTPLGNAGLTGAEPAGIPSSLAGIPSQAPQPGMGTPAARGPQSVQDLLQNA